MKTKYERDIYQFLSFYRFLAYSLAVIFIQVGLTSSIPRTSPLEAYLILGGLGVYTLLRVFFPFFRREPSFVTSFVLAIDFLLCMLLVICTNGLNSSFLLYSLTPIMVASLLFSERAALSMAAVASLSLSIIHLTLGQIGDETLGALQGYNLTLLVIYTFFCFVASYVPFHANLNINRRIESEAIVEERRRIGREIHDSVAQSISYLNMKLTLLSNSVSSKKNEQAMSELDEIREVVRDTYGNIRESIDQLSVETGNLPLIPTLTGYITRFEEKNNIEIQSDFPSTFPQISPVAELQLLRIAQEALTNTRKHTRATKVEVKLESNGRDVSMMIKDNGQGFTLPDEAEAQQGHYGLNIIRERAELLGGSVDISTALGEGTEIEINLPIERVRF
ncbi:sensor histidine kinase [Chloroflexota bacterium]